MPQIKEYQQNVEPNASVPDKRVYPNAFETMPHNAGGGLNDLAGVLQQEQERNDTSNVHVMMAQARADWTNHLAQSAQQASTDVSMASGQVSVGGEPATGGKPIPLVNVGNFSDKYMGDLSTYLTNAKQNVTTHPGSRLYDAMAANLHADLQEKAVGAQAHLTGLQAVANYNGVLNNYRNTLLNDPSQFASVLKEASQGLGSWVEIPADQRIKLMEQTGEKLALSAVQGWIKIDPTAALKQLNDGEWDTYLSAQGKYQLEHQADQGIRGREVEAARIAREQEKQEAIARMSTQNQFLNKLHNGTLAWPEIRDSNLLPEGMGSKREYMQLVDNQNKEGPQRTDWGHFWDTYRRIHLPAGDPNKIVNEDALNQDAIHGLYATAQLDYLRKEVQSDRTPEGERLNETKARLYHMVQKQFDTSAVFGRDILGGEQAFKFQQFVEGLIDKTRQAGGNPHDLFVPGNKGYVGQYIPQFERSLQEQMNTLTKSLQVNPNQGLKSPASEPVEIKATPQEPVNLPKRLPGETPDEWRHRMIGRPPNG